MYHVPLLSYDAESRIASVALQASPISPFVSYVYDEDGARVRKSFAIGDFTEYVNFGGQTIAEKDQTGAWTDYIYAGGKKIARVSTNDTRFHLTGTYPANSSLWVAGLVPVPSSLTIQQGDVLSYRIYQHNAAAYINLDFPDGSNADWYLSGRNHTAIPADTWTNLSYSLNGPMVGKPIIRFEVGDAYGPSGGFGVMLADVAITHADGSVTAFPVSGTAGYWGYNVLTNANFVTETVNAGIGATQQAHFYLADHLGTAQLEFAAGGWPVWQGQFSP